VQCAQGSEPLTPVILPRNCLIAGPCRHPCRFWCVSAVPNCGVGLLKSDSAMGGRAAQGSIWARREILMKKLPSSGPHEAAELALIRRDSGTRPSSPFGPVMWGAKPVPVAAFRGCCDSDALEDLAIRRSTGHHCEIVEVGTLGEHPLRDGRSLRSIRWKKGRMPGGRRRD